MLLRTRTSLGVTLSFVVMVGCLAFLVARHEAESRRVFAASVSAGYRMLWTKSIVDERHNMQTAVASTIAVLGAELPAALERRDADALDDMLTPVARHLAFQGDIDRLEVLEPSGAVLYNSHPQDFPLPILDAESLDEILPGDEGLSTLTLDSAQRPVQVVARRLGDLGIVVVAKSVFSPMRDIAAVAGGDTLLVSHYGHCLQGACDTVWPQLVAARGFRMHADLQTVDIGDFVREVISTELPHAFGRIATRLYVVSDITAENRRAKAMVALSLGGIILLLGGIVSWLWWYLRHAFQPIDDAIDVLDALSRGDTTAPAYGEARNDEVGAIIRSIDVFRENLLMLGRMKGSREKQRRRQERFIRRQMSELASGLDQQGRAEIMGDLAAMEAEPAPPPADFRPADARPADFRPADARPDGGWLGGARPADARPDGGWLGGDAENTGLGMIVPALQKLSCLVRNQHQRLEGLVGELTEALKTKTAYIAMQHDLEVARDIQTKIIPAVFPPFPDRHEFDLHAIMEPAKAVGGDLYDFFFIDDNRLFFMVGDVSDKGVPSALFMAIVRTLFRTIAATDIPLKTVFERVNDYLIANDVSQMFVTVFACVIDLRDGHVCFVDGGHEPPILFGADGAVRVMEKQGGLALGFLEFEYEAHEFHLAPGDGIVLYSDGINEAMNDARQMFKLERAVDVVKSTSTSSDARVISAELVRQVHAHADGAPQSDDITVLVFRFLGAAGAGAPPPPGAIPALAPVLAPVLAGTAVS
jgi:sigma-B regulation protein RsbU (phosphoserine phosphatase)